ncbi:MAG: nuclear transport factor 2 family protein [Chloroflexi bacterium]|nr:nuclear transport factor 2 family protein [Chloroflexota bacterium]
MRPKSLIVIMAVAVLSVVSFAQADSHDVAEELIKLTKAQWAAAIKQDTTAASKILADDYTEFNRDSPTRLEGKEAIRLSAAVGSKISLVAAEMANPKVQVYGEVAILTYNFSGSRKDESGKVEPFTSKSTRVYTKQGGKWMLVHANFAEVE